MSYTIGEVVFETSLFLTVTKDMHKIDKTSRFIGQKYLKSDQPQDKINPMELSFIYFQFLNLELCNSNSEDLHLFRG